MIIAEAQRQGLDPALVLEVAQVESGMNPNAVSPKGAIGVMQLMPATAAQLGVDPWDPQQNIQGGVTYLRQLLARFGDPTAALAAYNWGPENVSSAIAQNGSDFSFTGPQGTIPAWLASAPFETRNYVTTILKNVSTQYSVVTANTSVLALPGGGTSALMLPPGGPAPQGKFSWGTVALVVGLIFGIGLVLQET
jgi:soluble lytic murein transglycosylase-like protein